jgi:hypothetical protein
MAFERRCHAPHSKAPSHAKQRVWGMNLELAENALQAEVLKGVVAAVRLLINQTAGCAANERWQAACVTARQGRAPTCTQLFVQIYLLCGDGGKVKRSVRRSIKNIMARQLSGRPTTSAKTAGERRAASRRRKVTSAL